MKNLIIVESPTKAKTIKNFLGRNYQLVASKGHIRDLPKSSFGIKIEDDKFIPQYRVSKEYSATAKELKDLAKKADKIYIATDEDREGEAIGFHIAHILKQDINTIPRIVFHEITKKAILDSLKNPRTLDLDKVNAQQSRRLLDRIVGYKLSPLLSSKIQKGLSAGRVQSSALKIIVDREREIESFKPIEYHTIEAIFLNINTILVEFQNNKIDKFDIKNQKDADIILDCLKNKTFKIDSLEKKKRITKTPPPFMTSTLQQNASTNLGFSPKRTMSLAQSLYEGVKTDDGIMGLITYMRTDSLNIADEAIENVRALIENKFSIKYLPKEAKKYNKKSKNAQEAHEAIRPTRLDFTPEIAKNYLKDDELKLYKLIYNRFIASQMVDAEFESQTLIISSQNGKFKANGRKLVFDGFYKILGNNDKDKLLPDIKVGDIVKQNDMKNIQHFTEPPSRYSEASLIKTLENLGIGRPSTYAPTISTLQARNYINIEKKQIISTEMAKNVIEVLEKHFANIVDSNFTANMEELLDEVADKKKDWQELLKEFYFPFMDKIEAGKKNIKSQKIMIPIGENCPKCGEELVKRLGRFGEFISCSTFPSCKYTRPLNQKEKPIDKLTDIKCSNCGKNMILKNGKFGQFLACSDYPTCKTTKTLKEPKILEVKCPECGGNLIERFSKRGSFFGCSNYPKCKFISKYPPIDKKCPECNYTMAKKTLKKGDVYVCLNKDCKYSIHL